jgi:hypothetical protein
VAVWNQISTSQFAGSSRFDAEFWKPDYLSAENAICATNHGALGNLVSTFKKGIFYILAREYSNKGVPFYRVSNVGDILPTDEGLTFITETKHRAEYRTALSKGDLMIVKTRRSAPSIVLTDRCNVSQDIIATRVHRDRVNPYYLAVYLNTRFGRSQINRWFQGQLQPHLSLPGARRIWVPLAPDAFQLQSETLVRKAAHAREQSERTYKQAEEILESDLGIANFTLNSSSGYVVSFSEVVASRRSDAQHYCPSFEQLIKHLSTLPTKRIRDVRSYNRRGLQPVYSPTGRIDVVNSQHLGTKHIDYDGLQKTSERDFLITILYDPTVAHVIS